MPSRNHLAGPRGLRAPESEFLEYGGVDHAALPLIQEETDLGHLHGLGDVCLRSDDEDGSG
eukprot:CAMPEP_0202436374 /NCGR_PEP_ID=MMETSP1345-20130828/24191_1 /ASSEMBLY_ACC=CAM_ASM_000843 /TAXON_ID=342563 /ORGANISM="Fabrea Fabrea salina" /LENGTH=60 /DNA_ID=CAMNT_0049049731 /DNA_START=352 /DNA_END=534 /DNA_ORIENTATION=-